MSQAEAGIGCPISMTYSVIPALRTQPELAAEWEPRFLSAAYDPRNAPAAREGRRAGRHGDDREAGRLRRPRQHHRRPRRSTAAAPGAEYVLTGHKWFCSAPMCDVFLVLAQADGGISCFLFPRWTPDGERNRFRLQRLKDKLGNRSNASSEVEFDGASARLVGEEGARRADDHRDGQPHPPRLRDRRRHRDARGRRAGDPPRRPPLGLRQARWSTSR